MDSLLFPTCFYFMRKFRDSVSLQSQYPFDGKDNAQVGYCVEKYIYLFDYVFLSMYTGQNKGSKWQGYNKAEFSVFKLDAGELLQMSSSCLKCGHRQNLWKQWEQLWSLQFTLSDQSKSWHSCLVGSLSQICFTG